MIFGRTYQLWLGLSVAVTSFAGVIGTTILGFPAEQTLIVVGSLNGVLGALILLIANGPPTVAPGAPVVVQTAHGQPNVTIDMPTAAELVDQPT